MRGARRTWSVRRSAARAHQRRRWAFFSSLLAIGQSGKRGIGRTDDTDTMQDEALLRVLEELAEKLQIPVTYAALATEELPGRGGMCVFRGERRIIIERSLGMREKARLLAEGLAEFDFEDVFLLPAVREAIERARRARPQS